ncbi:hypothetical protein CP969_04920 [Streptomyces viridosporus T7A]|uniref:Regulatory protein n=2 Tax=Streptomyces viridosporus TaxID=67581 RepID=A0ABX6A8M9_STRVD|nr:hypothetical protein CP969_04920 [Streptomyces viridosporus T7A]
MEQGPFGSRYGRTMAGHRGTERRGTAMSENTTTATDLTSQYTAQVASDLERNVKEQENVAAEIAALQERLTVLRRDHAVLVNMQQALGIAPVPVEPVAAPEEPVAAPAEGAVSGDATVPAPRRKSRAGSGADRPKRGKTPAASGRGTSGKPARASSGARTDGVKTNESKTNGAKTNEARTNESKTNGAKTNESKTNGAKTNGTKSNGTKLVELVRQHLAEQTEPRSAAEIAASLGRVHPERVVKTTVVRSTLEGLVARNQAQRTKQGTSVFYTTPDNAGQSPKGEEDNRS